MKVLLLLWIIGGMLYTRMYTKWYINTGNKSHKEAIRHVKTQLKGLFKD